MTTVHVSQERGRHLRRRQSGKSQLLLPFVVFAAVAFTAFVYIGYVLWPRWPTPRLDAPALPITVAGVAFNLPPAAIRVPALLIQAKDDVFIPFEIFEHPAVRANPYVHLCISEHGGHLGFLSRKAPRFWADHVILEWIQTNAREAVGLEGQVNFEVV